MGITKTDSSRYGSLRGSSQPQAAPQQNTVRTETLRFHTPEPIPYFEKDPSIGLALDVSLTCEGDCEWRVCDAAVFGKNCLPGAELNEHLENELCLALRIALTKLSSNGVPFAELPNRSDEIGASLAEDLFPLWRDRLGIQATRFRLTSVSPQKEEAEKLTELRLEAKLTESEAAAQALMDAQREALAAAQDFPAFPAAPAAPDAPAVPDVPDAPDAPAAPAPSAAGGWTCPGCGAVNQDNFCPSCGAKRPE